MNNSLVLSRIQSQVKKIDHTPRIFPNVIVPKKKELSEPLKEEEIKKILMDEIQPKIEIKKEIIKEIEFNINSFCDWYLTVRTNFTEPQAKSLDTLSQARSLVNMGCSCSRTQRSNRAEDYFKNFWENNVRTDMITKVGELLGIKKIKFVSRGNIFLDLNLP